MGSSSETNATKHASTFRNAASYYKSNSAPREPSVRLRIISTQNGLSTDYRYNDHQFMIEFTIYSKIEIAMLLRPFITKQYCVLRPHVEN